MQVYMGCNKSVSTVEDPSSNSPQQAHRVRLTRHFHTWRQSVLRRIRDVVDIPQYATRRGVPVIIPSQPPERFAFLGGKFDALSTSSMSFRFKTDYALSVRFSCCCSVWRVIAPIRGP
jgi:hypothetical protein